MDRINDIQVTPQQILIPRTVIPNWGEIEVTQTEQHIVLHPKTPSPVRERELALQADLSSVNALAQHYAQSPVRERELALQADLSSVNALAHHAQSPVRERELALQALREDGLLYEPEWESGLPVILDEERAELSKRLGAGRPLSEIIIEEREDRA